MDFLSKNVHIFSSFLMFASIFPCYGQLLSFGLTAGLDGNNVQQPYGLVGGYPIQVDQTPYLNTQMYGSQGCISCGVSPVMQYPSYYPAAVNVPIQPYMPMNGYGGMPSYGPRLERSEGPIKKFWKGAAEGLLMTGIGGVFGRR